MKKFLKFRNVGTLISIRLYLRVVFISEFVLILFLVSVIKQKYDIQVNDEYVIAGNTAVLKCKIPNYVGDYVMVTSWVQDMSVNIYPNTDIGGKYVVLGNGDLYISNAGASDGYKSYACRTVHRLTGKFYLFFLLFFFNIRKKNIYIGLIFCFLFLYL